ncbi:hypothetical protein [Streptomyces chrestomyceticus]|uniref:hypothetical protein n=1 Tax=Streptomyces chrestomyceticus TaxID=68185 RepID=UPI0019D0ACA1|nr:hypothetical protein [Streptomyces chrestomyceticus]
MGGALYWRQHKHPRVPSHQQPVWPVVLEHASTRMAAHAEHRGRGEDRWRQAERGTPGDTLLHRVARTLVSSREPVARTAIVERLNEAVPGAGHTERMAAVRDVLTSHAIFVDVTGGGALAGRPPRQPLTG